MNYLVFDVETTNLDKGSPWNERNHLVSIAILEVLNGNRRLYYYSFIFPLYRNVDFKRLKQLFLQDVLLVGHNIKFDLHWLWRQGIEHGEQLWDTMFPPFVEQPEIRGKKGALTLDRLSGTKEALGNRLVHTHGICPSLLPPSWVVYYNIRDVLATEKVFLEQTTK